MTDPLKGRIEYRLNLSSQSSEFGRSKKRPLRDDGNRDDAGLFFIATGDSRLFLLLIPHHWVPLACDSARYKLEVQLNHYEMIVDNSISVIRCDDLELLQQAPPTKQPLWDTASTLSEMKDLEIDRQLMSKHILNTRCDTYTIKGIVQKISPIIALKPQEPFALMELTDFFQEEEEVVVVVVLRGDLTMHAAIHPGCEILLCNVRRQRWNVASASTNQVLVVTDSHSIHVSSRQQDQSSMTYIESPSLSFWVVEGLITRVLRVDNGTVQRIEVQTGEQTCIIYLAYLPLSPNQRVALVVGSSVKIMNLHRLPLNMENKCYGADLKSTLIITKIGAITGESKNIIPYLYSRIRETYFHSALKEHLGANNSRFTLRAVLHFLHARKSIADVDASDQVVKNGKKRCGFTEFFAGVPPSKNLVPLPILVDLIELRNISTGVAQEKLREFVASSRELLLSPGMMVSAQINSSNVIARKGGDDGQALLVTTGTVKASDGDCLLLEQENLILPVTLEDDVDPSLKGIEVHVDVIACSVSAVCIGKTPQSNRSSDTWRHMDLEEESGRLGSSSIVSFKGMLYFLSLHLHCSSICGATSKGNTVIANKEKSMVSIRDILQHNNSFEPKSSIIGVLCRHRFKFTKAKSNIYEGAVLTLASCSTNSISKLSSLQSIELKLTIQTDNRKRLKLMNKLRAMLQDPTATMLDEKIDVVLSLSKVAEGMTTSALLVGGISERRQTNTPLMLIPKATFPISACRAGTHGYIRFHNDLGGVRGSLVPAGSSDMAIMKPCVFDFVGGSKTLPGMLDSVPKRRVASPFSELQSSPPTDDIPVSSLSDLHKLVCSDIRNCTQSSLCPSMVRCVRGAKLISLFFCRALAECGKCFKPLKERSGRDGRLSGVVSKVPNADSDDTFWNVPLPINDAGQSGPSAQKRARKDRYPFSCPNGCSVEHSTVKWECSGVIDDGTGQAKLYAEREAALMLLGISNEFIFAIENGAMDTSGGIVFQKALPPSPFVKQAIHEARSLAFRLKQRHVKNKDVFSCLTPRAKAEFLLQEHCRYSHGPRRLLYYYVRCKPISEKAFHLNQTQISTSFLPAKATHQPLLVDVPTYSLAPLKLSLVDCSRPEPHESDWDQFRKLLP